MDASITPTLSYRPPGTTKDGVGGPAHKDPASPQARLASPQALLYHKRLHVRIASPTAALPLRYLLLNLSHLSESYPRQVRGPVTLSLTV